VFGCTLEPLNQSPVTHTVIETDPRDLVNCRPSLEWDGTSGPAPGGGVHRTSNFRSAHNGGAHFLYADASVQFIADSIDLGTYRAMSTIAGAEPVDSQD
jgi:prepilin-type processing-associated H-X9-DG protein